MRFAAVDGLDEANPAALLARRLVDAGASGGSAHCVERCNVPSPQKARVQKARASAASMLCAQVKPVCPRRQRRTTSSWTRTRAAARPTLRARRRAHPLKRGGRPEPLLAACSVLARAGLLPDAERQAATTRSSSKTSGPLPCEATRRAPQHYLCGARTEASSPAAHEVHARDGVAVQVRLAFWCDFVLICLWLLVQQAPNSSHPLDGVEGSPTLSTARALVTALPDGWRAAGQGLCSHEHASQHVENDNEPALLRKAR